MTEQIENSKDAEKYIKGLIDNANAAHKSEHFARHRLFDISSPMPGFIGLPDSFYTGWFYLNDKGKVFSVNRNRIKEGIPLYCLIGDERRKLYFNLEKETAISWDSIFKKRPISRTEFKHLLEEPGLEAHPRYRVVLKTSLSEYAPESKTFLDGFWKNTKHLLDHGTKEELAGYLKENILELAMTNMMSNRLYRRILNGIAKSMEASDITVYQIDGQLAVVAYERNGKTVFRSIYMPREYLGLFQRHLNKDPMSYEEFKRNYLRTVKSDSPLFRD